MIPFLLSPSSLSLELTFTNAHTTKTSYFFGYFCSLKTTLFYFILLFHLILYCYLSFVFLFSNSLFFVPSQSQMTNQKATSTRGPIFDIADWVLKDAWMICFDEFQVIQTIWFSLSFFLSFFRSFFGRLADSFLCSVCFVCSVCFCFCFCDSFLFSCFILYYIILWIQVTDIATASLLSNLFSCLIDRGAVIVLTSNRALDGTITIILLIPPAPPKKKK